MSHPLNTNVWDAILSLSLCFVMTLSMMHGVGDGEFLVRVLLLNVRQRISLARSLKLGVPVILSKSWQEERPACRAIQSPETEST